MLERAIDGILVGFMFWSMFTGYLGIKDKLRQEEVDRRVARVLGEEKGD